MILFPSGKDPELLTFLFGLPAGNEMRGAGLLGLHSPNLMYPVAYGHSRRELTPVRLCSVRLSWRQRARPSTTLHEIQICRSRLEYIVCITAGGGPQLACTVGRKLYRRSGCATYVMVSRKSGQREGVYEGLPEVCREFLDEGIRDNGLFGWLTKQANGDTQEEHGG